MVNRIIGLILLVLIFPAIGITAHLDLPRDDDGWTIFTPTAPPSVYATRIMYVSAVGDASDANVGDGTYYNSTDLAIGADPFNPVGPVDVYPTYAAAYADARDGYPDWILFKRGETFTDHVGHIGVSRINGKGFSEPALIGAYGSSGASPILETPPDVLYALNTNTEMLYFAMANIDFYAYHRNPEDPRYEDPLNSVSGLYIRRGVGISEGLLVEGCKFRFFLGNEVSSLNRDGVSASPEGVLDIELRRCSFLDSHGTRSGLYSKGVRNLVVYQCIFDHNAWYDQAGTVDGISMPTFFDQGFYFESPDVITIDQNIFMRSASGNIKHTNYTTNLPSSLVDIKNNLVVDGEFFMTSGTGSENSGANIAELRIQNNVVTQLGRSNPTNREFASGITVNSFDSGQILNNLIINQELDLVSADSFLRFRNDGYDDSPQNTTVDGNVAFNLQGMKGVWDDPGVSYTGMVFSNNKIQQSTSGSYTMQMQSIEGWTYSGNEYYSNLSDGNRFAIGGANKTNAEWAYATSDNSEWRQVSFTDSTRDVDTYMDSIGGTATVDGFITAVRAQDRYSWNPALTAPVVNSWIQAGFDVEEVIPSITLTDNTSDYTIENDHYKAVIAKGGNYSSGLVFQLYVKKSDGSWSNQLLYDTHASSNFGLGYLEGAQDATNNAYPGFVNGATVTVTSATDDKIIITATRSYELHTFKQIWTFYAGLPYFQREATVTNVSADRNTNQYQFAEMIKTTLAAVWTGTDENGNIDTFVNNDMQNLHGPNLSTYPWINWAFTDEEVSLGCIQTELPWGTIGDTGDWPFEYQLNFQLGGGFQGSPTKPGLSRSVTTLYYTSPIASNTAIDSFASSKWAEYQKQTETTALKQAAQVTTNAYGQQAGIASALVSDPYFLIRQNFMAGGGTIFPQYETWIYTPMFTAPKLATRSWGQDHDAHLSYTLNYNDGSTDYIYGTVGAATPTNGTATSLVNTASSANGEVDYSTTFKTWDDSDKLQITGAATNGDSESTIKDIWASLKVRPFYVEAEHGMPIDQIVYSDSLVGTDGKWNSYGVYPFDYRSSLVYRDNQETVQPVEIDCPFIIAGSQYKVTAIVRQSHWGAVSYRYSSDGVNYSTIAVSQGDEAGVISVDLGVITMPSKSFYIDDDNSISGASDWVGWDRIAFTPIFTEVAAGYYDLQWDDEIYGPVGIGVKTNTPASAAITDDGLEVYLLDNETAQATTTFNHTMDIEVHPHMGLYDQVADFGDLHTKTDLTYSWPEWGVTVSPVGAFYGFRNASGQVFAPAN